MLPDRVSNPGLLTYESGALPIALRGPANRRAQNKLAYSTGIGVGRFRILGGGGGGPRFRILGRPRGPNSQQAHDVVTTSMRRNDVASTSFRRRVPTRF